MQQNKKILIVGLKVKLRIKNFPESKCGAIAFSCINMACTPDCSLTFKPHILLKFGHFRANSIAPNSIFLTGNLHLIKLCSHFLTQDNCTFDDAAGDHSVYISYNN
jgi:hypothetical protein